MSIKRLTINGLRGFSEETDINFAIPDNNNPGSGLTILVGPNNSGKSTIIEAIHMLNSNIDIIPRASRNVKTQGYVKIEAEDINGNITSIKSTKNKGAFIERSYNGEVKEYGNNMNTFILSSKRSFSSTFHSNDYQSRENYKGNIGENDYRSENNINYNFGGRLLTIYKNRKMFDNCLEKVLSPLPEWTIESTNDNSVYLEFDFDGIKHSSKGAGDGYINIFNIVDALYDSSENNVILIDEPEISLHPDLQRKLFSLLIEYSKDKQIIVSTHSPYFVDWKLFSEHAKIIRFKKVNNTIRKFELTAKSQDSIKKILKDSFQPHILSLDANEIFFLNDNVILTEGQDDVLCYKQIFNQYNYKTEASFFGWGAGGAPKIEFVLNILEDLGYEKVFTVLDNDQRSKMAELKNMFPQYEFYAIVANDVRNKPIDKNIKKIIDEIQKLQIENEKKEEIINFINSKFKDVEGLVADMSTYEVNKKYESDIINLLEYISIYFGKESSTENKLKKVVDNSEIDEKAKARQLLDKWLMKNKIFEDATKIYPNFEFSSGGGGELSFKEVKKHKYYVIIEQGSSISESHSIIIYYHFRINTQKNKVKLKRKQIFKNTLPISKLSKILCQIFI